MIDMQNETGRRWATAVLVGAALLSAAYWTEATLLRFRQGKPEAALRASATALPSASSQAETPPSTEALSKLLGAQARTQTAPLGPAERFKVLGVIASASGRGTALVAVDGKPPRAYSVGAELAPGFVIKSLTQKDVALAASPGGELLVTLPLPEPSATNPNSGAGSTGVAGPPAAGGSRSNPRDMSPSAATTATNAQAEGPPAISAAPPASPPAPSSGNPPVGPTSPP